MTFSTHIVGGEVYYDYLGNNNYFVTVKVYRDCSSSSNAAYDNPAKLMIYNGDGSIFAAVQMADPIITNVPNQINNPCITTPNLCVEEAIYTTTVNLPANTTGYDLVYQRCCRNNTIINLIQPGSVGATYMEHIPPVGQISVNSSPRFNNRPLKFICNGIPIEFDHSATDPDGDQLVYSLCDPFTGLDACCPMLTASSPNTNSQYCINPPTSCPENGQPPPYAFVPFLSPYSASYPLSSNPSININSQTGFLDGIPNINGQWVVGVCVSEYRNGVLIGTHKRDFQFNVVQCQVVSSAAVASQTVFCTGYTVSFDNNSVSNSATAPTYFWNFGDPTTLADTSILMEPTYTYPDTGVYTVHLLLNEGLPCADSTELNFHIYPELAPDFDFSYSSACINNNSFDFVGTGTFAPYATFSWDFGPSAIPQSSTNLIQNNVEFLGQGPFQVTLTMNQAICSESHSETIVVYPEPQAYFSPQAVLGCQPQYVQFLDSSTVQPGASYMWYFGDGDSSSLVNPTHVYQDTGIYSVTLTISTTTGCIDTSTFTVQNLVSVRPAPQAGFFADPLITDVYNPVFNFYDTSYQAVSWEMIMGDGSTYPYVPSSHYYEEYGEYEVIQVVYGSNGCPDTFKLKIYIKPEHLFWIPNAFTPNGDYINGVFKPEIMGVVNYEFYVFDRWGEKIFETHETKEGWDGTYKGKKCQEDVYIYLIKYRDVPEEADHVHSGRVTLIR